MPLPSSGQMKFSEINVELGRSSTTQVSLNESAVRSLFGVSSGPIKKSNGRGKSNAFTFNKTISTNTQNYNLLADMIANGYTNGSAFTANITVNSGVYVWSDSTSVAGFDTGGITGTGTINLTNNGYIMGKGGSGGGSPSAGTLTRVAAGNGGPAINIQKPVIIVNNSYIGGGGGGGGYASSGTATTMCVGGGGGAGGGAGGSGSYSTFFYAGDAGGAVGSNGSPTTDATPNCRGSSGGRVMPGTVATSRGTKGTTGGGYVSGINGSSAGGGGAFFMIGQAGSSKTINPTKGSNAGLSGDVGSVNFTFLGASGTGGGGGGYGAAGGVGFTYNSSGSTDVGAGGAGGKAINLNGNSVTWITTGTVYGAVT